MKLYPVIVVLFVSLVSGCTKIETEYFDCSAGGKPVLSNTVINTTIGNIITVGQSGYTDVDWTGPNGFSQNNKSSVYIPLSAVSQSGVYTAVGNKEGCKSDPATFTINVSTDSGACATTNMRLKFNVGNTNPVVFLKKERNIEGLYETVCRYSFQESNNSLSESIYLDFHSNNYPIPGNAYFIEEEETFKKALLVSVSGSHDYSNWRANKGVVYCVLVNGKIGFKFCNLSLTDNFDDLTFVSGQVSE